MGTNNKIGLWVLTALVVGNMVGSGIFMLPRTLSQVASPAGVISAWLVTGFGVLMIALVFGNLAIRKPHLTGGPQIYAKELFTQGSNASTLSGFMVSWGYWIGNASGNIAIITTFAGYLSTFFPVMTSEAELFTVGGFTLNAGNLITFIICSALLWFVHFLILNGIERAGQINFIATATKVVAFLLVIIVGLFAFDKANILPFVAPKIDDAGNSIGLLGQINSAAVATLWAFVGVESAMILASRAKKPLDVKRATKLGLFIALAIYIGISTLVLGMLNPSDLLASDKPLIDAISTVLGPIGGKALAAVALISLLGSTIGWILVSAEIPYQAAKQGLFLPRFAKTNKNGMPVFSLVVSNLLGQVFIFSTISNTIASAFDFIIIVATLSYLLPYLISSVFQIKLAITGETYESNKNRKMDIVVGVLASLYSVWVIYAGTADMKTFVFGVLLLASGALFYKRVKNSNAIDNNS